MIMRRLGRRTGQHRDATATPLESRRTGGVGVPLVRRTASRRARPRRAAGEADGVPAGAAKACPAHTKKGAPTSYDVGAPRSTAATYSPNWCVSTIGARGLNCSVRYGKRWDPAAKATANIT